LDRRFFRGYLCGNKFENNSPDMKSPEIFLLTFLFCLGAFWASGQDLGGLGQAKPVQLHSGLSLTGSAYRATGIEPRQDEGSWFLTGSPTLDIYGVSLPFNFTLSNHHRGFQQPFNQFGLSPYYKWAKLHLGYNGIRFSPFTLNGQRFLGVGAELTPGKLRFAAVRGRFQKAVPRDTTISNVPGAYLSSIPVPAFDRMGTGVKLGFGSNQNYVDLIFLKARDRPGSIVIPTDTVPKPQENAVAGLSWQLTMFRKLTWKTDLAVSAFTQDQNSDSLEIEDFPGEKLLKKILLPRSSSQLTLAGETSLGYRGKNFGARLQYRRIEPDYRSMGAFFFQRDVEQYTVNSNVSMARQKVRLNGTIGWQRNNLLENRLATTRRLIGSASLEVQPTTAFGVSLYYSNFGLTQTLEGTGLADTLALRQVNQNLTATPRLFIKGDAWNQHLNLVLNYNATTGMEDTQFSQPDNFVMAANLSYFIQKVKDRTALNATLSWRRIDNGFSEILNIGGQAGVQRPFFENKVSAGLSAGGYFNRPSLGASSRTMFGSLTLNYFFSEKHSLFTSINYLKQSLSNDADPGFSEWTGQAGINLNF
jgi:hypothetical protein